MGLFDKNQNETAFAGGKKHWADVIKNTGPGELLIWRQPEEDFNTNSTLIVMPGEEAIFIKGGTVEQTFENGTYKLSTENYPFISRLRNAFTGGVSTFNCVVYFVRKAHSIEIKWGTDSPIQVRDKIHGIVTNAKVRGAYKIQIENPVMFLEKLIGNNVPYQMQEELPKYFASEFQGKIKTVISKFLNSLEQELIGLDAYIDDLSEQVTPFVDEALGEYGLRCVKFSLAALDIDISKYDAIDAFQIQSIGTAKLAHGEALGKVEIAQGDKAVMGVLGDDWGRQQAADILKATANNPGAGGVASAGAGMGMGMAAGNIFGSMAQEMFRPMGNVQPQQQFTGQPVSGRFTQQSAAQGQPTQNQPAQEDPIETLGRLKKMLDTGLIEQAEYDAKKTEILSRM